MNHREDFHKVYERGAKRVGRLLVVYLLPAGDFARSVVASRKVGGAVKRNRAKRLLREAYRNGPLADPANVPGVRARFFPESGGPEGTPAGDGGLWIVLVARHRILTAGAQDVLNELQELLAD
ncbi:MAG: ribonuclease P protein component [bacterium]|nr:ribonuclease P protein component [bacterium]